MAYVPYADETYYLDEYRGSAIPTGDLPAALLQASRHVDTLTYNRIVGQGFCDLTLYQQDLIKEVVCRQADFEYENADVIDTVLQSYGINGVSIQFGATWNVQIHAGVAMRRDVYAQLAQTGLTCRLVVR